MRRLRRAFLVANSIFYGQVLRRILFLQSADTAHQNLLALLSHADKSRRLLQLAGQVHHLSFPRRYISVGGVMLLHPFIVAAGLVKGHGFIDEDAAVKAVDAGNNIIPGWHSVPALLGAVEFGSFTRYPRMGNPGVVIWRDGKGRYTQNRVGLKNPGALAAAAFLARHKRDLPPRWGINIAVSPGVTEDEQAAREVCESLSAFINQGIRPRWFTLNISCPNTEDDPQGRQTEGQTRALCKAAITQLRTSGVDIPLWVKVSPALTPEQYDILMRVFAQEGVRAVIATNTLPLPAPDNSEMIAGVSGALLHLAARTSTTYLMMAKVRHQYPVDVVGCGGVLDGISYQDFKMLGIDVVQYWSALVFRGPLAAPIIESELP